jgi:CMP-N-acetylneuraminic acid synthetase
MSIFCNNKKPESNRNISLGFELFAGKWAIEAAIKSQCLDRYVVSTEEKEAVRIAR